MGLGFIGQEISRLTVTADSSSLSATTTTTTTITSHQPSQVTEPWTSPCVPGNVNTPEPHGAMVLHSNNTLTFIIIGSVVLIVFILLICAFFCALYRGKREAGPQDKPATAATGKQDQEE